MEINKINMSHRALFEENLKKYPVWASDVTFSNLFMWRHYYKAEFVAARGFICAVLRPRCIRQFYFQPLGPKEPENFKALVDDLKELQRERNIGESVNFKRVDEEWLACIRKAFPEERLVVNFDRSGSDYVYLKEDLINLRGKKYDGKRNHLKKFLKLDNTEFIKFDSTNINEHIRQECLDIITRWSSAHNYEEDSVYFCENLANRELIENFEKLNLKGALVKVDGKSEAFTIGEEYRPDAAVVHVEKANLQVRGLYVYINKQFTETAWGQEIIYINREEDLGIEGLRKAKKSYNPVMMINKYDVYIK